MKITKTQLKKIIKEELLKEIGPPPLPEDQAIATNPEEMVRCMRDPECRKKVWPSLVKWQHKLKNALESQFPKTGGAIFNLVAPFIIHGRSMGALDPESQGWFLLKMIEEAGDSQ